MPYWVPERMWGTVPVKNIPIGPPELKPDGNMNGVPMLYLNCIAPEGPSPTYYGEKPGLSKFVSQAGLVNVPSGQLEPMSSVLQARHDPENLVGQVHDWGGCHLDMTDDMARLIALFIEKAAKYRLSDEIPPAGLPKLKALHASDGWLAPMLLAPLQSPMATEPEYKGDKTKAVWFFDREMAEAAMGFEIENRTKLPQAITVVSNGKTLAPLTTGFAGIGIPADTALDDGFTFKLTGAFLDTVPVKDSTERVPIGHAAAGQVVVKPAGGTGFAQVDENTFRYRRTNSNNHGWFYAYHPGDKRYSRMCYPANIEGLGSARKGTPQTITFPEIANVRAGTDEIKLHATSDVHGQVVEYYVISGPAELVSTDPKYTGNTLCFTPIPPNAKYPMKVIVAAYQMGRTIEPRVQTAQEVIREFFIVNTTPDELGKDVELLSPENR
jgi:hypothetical protein